MDLNLQWKVIYWENESKNRIHLWVIIKRLNLDLRIHVESERMENERYSKHSKQKQVEVDIIMSDKIDLSENCYKRNR